MDKKQKILIYDIEVSYTVGAVWGLYDQNVAKVIRDPFIISVAWKWLGEKTTHVIALPDFKLYKKDKFNDKELVEFIHDELFNKAEIIIAHNGNGYDQKWCYGRFAVHGFNPPSPSKYIDTLLVCRNKFKFNSNRLKDLGKYFNLGDKVDIGGIDLWIDCVEHNSKTDWNLMKRYNKQDVVLLEKIYLHIRPFITNHPNMNLYLDKLTICPNCSMPNLLKRGYAITRVSKRQRYQCSDCGAWAQGESIKTAEGTIIR